MSFPYSGSFDYFLARRPLATVAITTGTFDYFKGGRPFPIGASEIEIAQVSQPLGSGDLIRFLQEMQFARRRRKKAPRPVKPTRDDAEVAATIDALPSGRVIHPMVPLTFRMVAPKIAAPVFVKLFAAQRHTVAMKMKASREYKDALELAEFNDVMALIVELEEA